MYFDRRLASFNFCRLATRWMRKPSRKPFQTDADGVPVRVMTAEHLTAIALKVGRPKDKIRVAQFMESGILDKEKLLAILGQHGLLAKWKQFNDKYLNE